LVACEGMEAFGDLVLAESGDGKALPAFVWLGQFHLVGGGGWDLIPQNESLRVRGALDHHSGLGRLATLRSARDDERL